MKENQNSFFIPPKEWLVLVTIRLVLNIFSQRSYIHPDEFFQGVEVISGDIFNCSIHRTWEFKEAPIRNMAIPYFFYGIPLYFLKYLSTLGAVQDYTLVNQGDLNLISIQTNTLIYYPRLFMTFYSLIIDLFLFQTAKICDLDKSSILITFASSYITNVYLTRTFSNSIEIILFSILIFLVLKSIKSQHILNDKFLIENKSSNNKVTNVISSMSNEFKINNSVLKNEASSSGSSTIKRLKYFDIYKYNYLGEFIGLVLCIGVFNRPTFVIYSFIPILYWLLHGLENANSLRQFFSFILSRALSLSKLFVPFAFILVLFDTIYFYKLNSIEELVHYVKNYKFIFTPYNFFVYNSNSKNLKEHGEHPFYQHFLNCFLLFGLNHLILGIITCQYLIQLINFTEYKEMPEIRSKFKRNFLKLKQKIKFIYNQVINNIFCFYILSFLIPLFAFSLVSHKEPRFLLPLLLPICLLTGHCLFGSQSYAPLRFVWFWFNIFNLLVFGYFHQGGLIPSIGHVQKIFSHVSNLEMDQHVIFYHTYMPPRYLIMAPVSVNLINNKRYLYEFKKNEYMYESDEDIEYDEMVQPKRKQRKHEAQLPVRKIYDLMSSSNGTQLEELILEIKNSYTNKNSQLKNYAIFLVAPSVVENDFLKSEDCSSQKKKKKTQDGEIGYHLISGFKFHITFEHLKDHLDYLKCDFGDRLLCLEKNCKKMSLAKRILNSFSINLYQIIL